MKNLHRITAFILALCLALSLAACGGGGSTNTAELKDNTYVSGFPIVKDKVKLKILTTKQPFQLDYDKMPFTTYYEDLSNVEIEWELCGWGSEATEKIQLDFFSGSMPDVVSVTNGMFTDAMIDQFSAAGQLVDLEPYLEEWAPNIKKLMDMEPDSYGMCRGSDGKLYSLPRIVLADDNHMLYGNKCYIRKTWLDALGLEMPKTTEEYYKVLKAFKEGDPNGNGKADEIPLVFQLLQAEVFTNWGINISDLSSYMMRDQVTGKWAYAPATDNMRDCLAFYNRLYNENLLSQKVIGEPGRLTSMVQSGNVGVFYNLANFTVCDYDLAKEYVILPPLDTGKYPTVCYYGGFDPIMPNNLVISSSCKNVETALRWFDYFYTPLGSKLLSDGIPGDGHTYRITEDGKTEWLRDFNDSDTGTTPGGQIAYGYAPYFDEYYLPHDVPESEMTELEVFTKYLMPSCLEAYDGFIPKYELKYPRKSAELNELLSDYGKPLNEYALNMMISFLIGVKNVNSEWGTYITELKRMNMDEIVREYQKAYDDTYGDK